MNPDGDRLAATGKDERRFKRSPMILGAVVASMVLGPVVGLAILANGSLHSWNPDGEDSDIIRSGDTLLVHVQIRDVQGRLLYSTRASDRDELNAVASSFDAPFLVPALDKDRPMRYQVGDGLRPEPLDNTSALLAAEKLLGRTVGAKVAVPVLGEFEGYTEPVKLDRNRGSFNRSWSVETTALAALTSGKDDETVVLDSVLRARVVERGPELSEVVLDVREGEELTVAQTNFTARVVGADEDKFSLLLGTRVGHAFSLLKACEFARYVLPIGSYRVTELNETTISLARSPTKWPQLIGRDLVMVLEVVENLGQVNPQ